MHKHLHIICLNVPYPVDYGGVFDLYYKLPALQNAGIKIHLHCFEYGRGEQPVLNQYCEEVHYYPRNKGFSALSLRLPYIVSSRRNKSLLKRLAADKHPILMEGVHCTYLLNDSRFVNRKCFVRLHNVENIYYNYLLKSASSLFKKLYYAWESCALLRYEKSIANKASFLAVTEKDASAYKALGSEKVSYLPLFLPAWKVTGKTGRGCFCLYHGDLSVAENETAASWLLINVFSKTDIPFVIAGKNASGKLKQLVHSRPTTCLIENPSGQEMNDLIGKAHINIIPSYNATGIKLKLLNALFNGRHCVVNEATVAGSGLDECCHKAETSEEFIALIQQLNEINFTEKDLETRHTVLDKMYNSEENADRLIAQIWNG